MTGAPYIVVLKTGQRIDAVDVKLSRGWCRILKPRVRFTVDAGEEATG